MGYVEACVGMCILIAGYALGRYHGWTRGYLAATCEVLRSMK